MKPSARVGIGIDIHRLVKGRKCVLGGVVIPSPKGPDGHSDADVLVHAVCDALLGAAALGDIGQHFPDTDPQFKDIDSCLLLERVCRMLYDNRWQPINIDCVVITEVPRLSQYIPAMKEKLAAVMHIATDQISIKATTQEGMGFIGKRRGIAAHAVAVVAPIGEPTE